MGGGRRVGPESGDFGRGSASSQSACTLFAEVTRAYLPLRQAPLDAGLSDMAQLGATGK